jgi:hypothetical protein
MRKCVLVAVLLALLPCLALGASRDKAPYPAHPSTTPPADRGEEWIQYDFDNWPYTWNGAAYMCNMFFPRDPNWYPFDVTKLQFTFGTIDGISVGTINRVRIFDAGVNPVAEWVNLFGTAGVWQTVTAGSPPTVWNVGDPFYAGGWLETGDDSPLQGTVDASLWPGPYWPTGHFEAMMFVDHANGTSAATSGWYTNTAAGAQYATTSVVSCRALVSGETVPVELYELKGEPRRGYVVLTWSTASEQDNYGFNVYRSDSEDGAYAKINDELIPGHGTTSSPNSYVFADYEVAKGNTYYYKIEDVGVDGSGTLHGPVAVPTDGDVSSSWGVIKAVFK